MVNEKSLKSAAKELNEVLDLDPRINLKGTAKEISEGIKEAIRDCIKPDEDEFTDATQAVLDELAGEMVSKEKPKGGKSKPAPVEEEEEEDDDEDEQEDEDEDNDDDEQEDEDEDEQEEEKPKKAPAKKAGPKRPADGFSRTDSVCEALTKKPKTVADWIKKSNDIMISHGGKANDAENRTIIKFVTTALKHLAPSVKYPTA